MYARLRPRAEHQHMWGYRENDGRGIRVKASQKILAGICTCLLFVVFVGCVVTAQRLQTEQKEKQRVEAKVEDLKTEIRKLEKEIETLKEEQKQVELEKEKWMELEEKGKKVPAKGKKIAIDPGHQGPNVDMSDLEPMGPGSQELKAKASSGTQGRYTNVPEYELTLNISRQLQEELKKRGYETVLTREDHDTAISNSERALMAADAGADIYVRIHANGSEDPTANGAMTMVPSAENPFVGALHPQSYALGEHVINAYCQACGMENDGVQLYDNMTGINWSKLPVIILEMGYMTNEQDDVNMQNPEYQKKMVQGIADGIDQYFAAGN